MNSIAQFENRASSRRSKHEGESSTVLCDRLSRTRDFSQRQLPTDQDYAVPTREYQTDQSSLKPAPAAAGPVLDQRQKQRRRQKQQHDCAGVDRSLHIRTVLLQTPDSVEAHIALGSLLFQAKDFANAAEEFRRVLALQPANQEAVQLLKQCRMDSVQ
jgi:hypothetical protein